MSQCHCGHPAQFGTVKKQGQNFGKGFLRCPKWPNGQCQFFQWSAIPQAAFAPPEVVKQEPRIISPVPQNFSTQEKVAATEWGAVYSPATAESVQALERRVVQLEQAFARQNIELSAFFQNMRKAGKSLE